MPQCINILLPAFLPSANVTRQYCKQKYVEKKQTIPSTVTLLFSTPSIPISFTSATTIADLPFLIPFLLFSAFLPLEMVILFTQ